VLFVIKGGRFVATVTDGDIRRWILKKGNLDAKSGKLPTTVQNFCMKKKKTGLKNI